MNGYTIGFIIEGALALVLIIALIAVIAKKKKAPAAEAAGENAEEAMPQAAEESAEREKADAVSGEIAVAELAAALPEEELGNRISFAANERSFSEAYATLNEEQKRYFILLREYALHKPNATETRTARGVVIRSNKKSF